MSAAATKKGKKALEAKDTTTTTSNNSNMLTIGVESFVRSRDSFVTGLATLQDAIQTLSTAYIKHTNAVLGEHGAGLGLDLPGVESALSKLGDNPLFGGVTAGLNRAPSPTKTEVGEEKKERKKRQHDPNAPKRPLTAFFLYMQTARPIIANDLGASVPKGAVSAEGTRRWKDMSEPDRQLWSNAYKDNLRLYNARVHSYKSGNINAKDMSDDAAQEYADEHNIRADTHLDPSAQLIAETAVAAEDEDAEGEEDVVPEPAPTPKTPKAKATRKSKAVKEPEPEPESEPEPERPVETVIQPPSAVKPTPDKKRKRASTNKNTPIQTIEKEDVAVETPKPEKVKKSRSKKAKNDA